jgi:hypothetical protein
MQEILQAMKGQRAVVSAAGHQVTGTIVSVDGNFVMVVDEARDGKIALIPKDEISEVRGKVGPQAAALGELPPDGTGMLAGGGIMVANGAPLMISGLVYVGLIPSYTPLWLPQVLPAAVLLGGGIPLLVMGSRRRQAYNRALFGARLGGRITPSVGRTPGGGWTGGLSLRF